MLVRMPFVDRCFAAKEIDMLNGGLCAVQSCRETIPLALPDIA